MDRLVDIRRRKDVKLGDRLARARIERGHRLPIGCCHVLPANDTLERSGGQKLLNFRQQISGRCGSGGGHDGKLSPEEG